MRALVLALAAAALAAAPAGAATITSSQGTVVYRAQPGEALNVTVGFVADCSGALDCVTFYGDAYTWSNVICAAQADNSVWCVLDRGVQVVGGDGADRVSVLDADLGGFPAGAGYALAIDGGAGDDRLDGGSGPETIHGGPGADQIAGRGGDDALYGDDGNDTLRGDGSTNGNSGLDGGNDRLDGGPGDDVLTGDTPDTGAAIGHDVLDGGPGTDTITGDWFRFDGNANDEDPPPTVTFNGVADDGRPGENDDVEHVERIDSSVPAGPAATTYVGDDGPNTFMLLFTNGVVSGGGG
ncbi:MAG TPA: calcium-binding protein, partial [Solirubrobacter sp.]|nr:calcium-binding protein [Solirubrobacter sp.]